MVEGLQPHSRNAVPRCNCTKIAFEPYKQLASSAYAFWQRRANSEDTKADLKRLFSPAISVLHDLKRALMIEIASAGNETTVNSPSATGSNESRVSSGALTRVEINKLVNR